jgi:tape measure domain-containing protein
VADQQHGIVIEIDPTRSARGAADVVRQVEAINATLKTTQQLADSALSSVTEGVNGIGGASTKAKTELASLAGVAKSFEGLSEHFKRQADYMDRVKASAASGAFAGLAQHFQRQADMLERINGPMRQYHDDLVSLNALQARNAITAEQYTAQLERMNRAIGATPKPGLASEIGGGIMNGLGASALSGGAAGLAAVGASKALETAHSILELSDAYTNLDNRLRSVTHSDEERASLMERTHALADASRSDWATAGELYVRLAKATGDMNLGQERTLALTETISKAFAMSGASATEASAGMLQLSQAFASGRLQGDEFRTLNESVPDVLRLVAKEMHVTYGELKQLGSEGKITSDVLVAAFEHSASRSAPTCRACLISTIF